MNPWLRRAAAVLVLLASSALPALAGPQEPAAPAAELKPAGEDVVVWNRPIAELRAAYPPRTLRERADDVARRISSVPGEDLSMPVKRTPATLAGLKGITLSVGGRSLVFLSGEDVPEGGTLDGYAEAVAGRIREVLDARRKQTSLPDMLLGTGVALLSGLGAAALLLFLLRLRRRQAVAVRNFAARRRLIVAGVDISHVFTGLSRFLFSALVFSGAGVVLYVWLALALSEFPYTAPLSHRLGAYLLGVLSLVGSAFLGSLPGLFTATVIFLFARILDRVVAGIFNEIVEGRLQVAWMDPEPARASRRLATAIIWIFALVFAYPFLPGSGTDAFKGMSVLIGLMVSLGSAGIVNQLMSGFVVVYSRALQAGDWVRIGDTEGTVRVVGVLSTKIVTPRREEVTIPNAVIVTDRVVNFTRLAKEHGAVVATKVTIGYDAPWRQVHSLLLAAAAAVPLSRREPAPLVLQTALSDFYVEYELRVHHDRPEDRALLFSELHAAIQDAFNAAGIQIMSPAFETQPAAPVLVPKERWNGPPS